MHNSADKTFALHGNQTSLVIGLSADIPKVLYWGKRITPHTNGHMLEQLQLRQEVAASPTREIPLSLLPTLGQGFTGHPGLEISGKSDQWATVPAVIRCQQVSDNALLIDCLDPNRNVALQHRVSLDKTSDVIQLSTQIINKGAETIDLHWCAASCLPLPDKVNSILGFEGHWANEFQTQYSSLNLASYVRENRRGRTSHDSFPGLILHTEHCNQDNGEAYGFHLGWSGNHKILAERMADGRAYVQMGELLLPGEIRLKQNESYTTPTLYATYSAEGFNGLSAQFHRYVRQSLIRDEVKQKPRPVHYNTWEGIYFDHDMPTLLGLAEKAAEIGVERFVLDDGWFPGRKDDKAGLGDWFVDEQKYPEGLSPLISKVNQLGMEFGLWFEPEMVNPDSDLFRAHPDWVLSTPPNPDMGFRNQLVLDLTNQQVFDYLYQRLNTLLNQYNISYIKWDMNRDILQAGDSQSHPAIHCQTKRFYELLSKLRQAHPQVEIESCASGGGRADYGVLAHTDRIWTSDSNDGLNRLSIQRGFSYFFPPELMGSHVGPRHCHITHRHLSMALRCATAMFGHMGMEMDLRELDDKETLELKQALDIYKQHRNLIHTGRLVRLEMNSHSHGFGYVSNDKSHGLYSYTLLNDHATSMPGTYNFTGLDENKVYRLDIIWPTKGDGFWPDESLFHFDTCLPQIDGQVFSGESLIQLGLQLPRLVPQTSLVFHLTVIN